MLLSVLALGATLNAAPASLPSRLANEISNPPMVVLLGCQVRATALTDCKVVNDEPMDAATVAEALKLAAQVTVPAALADHNDGRIVVKMNVTR